MIIIVIMHGRGNMIDVDYKLLHAGREPLGGPQVLESEADRLWKWSLYQG